MKGSKILRPVFGRPCCECGDQIPQARIRVLENDAAAHGLPLMAFDVLCRDCKAMREVHERQARLAERPRDITIIRG